MADDKVDYLDVDEPIPGQNYVCLSFVSPESLMQEKEKFKTAKFLQSYCKDKKLEFKKVYEEYITPYDIMIQGIGFKSAHRMRWKCEVAEA